MHNEKRPGECAVLPYGTMSNTLAKAAIYLAILKYEGVQTVQC
jgi:hypothetical protein